MPSLASAAVLMFAAVVSASPQAAPQATETATQFYMRYRTVVAKATTVDEVTALWPAETAQEFNAAPPDQRVDLATLQRAYAIVSNVGVTQETASPDGSRVTLSLEGTGKDGRKVTGKAVVVKEKGVWKVVGPDAWS
jgi:hypothetical protein